MSQKTMIITGASDGVGAAAARTLTERGEQVVVVGRDPAKTERVARDLGAPWHVADFSEFAQVRRLADEVLAAYPRIDVLANNAGGLMRRDREITVDGIERTLQVNHLSPFLLTHLLMPRLLESGASVVQTSSAASRGYRRRDLTDLQGERRYSAFEAYAQSKLLNILFTREFHRRYAADGLSAAAFHPGVVASSFAADSGSPMRWLYTVPVVSRLLTVTPDQGADQLVWLAQGTPGVDWQSGAYYEKRRITTPNTLSADDAAARQLWDESARLVGVTE